MKKEDKSVEHEAGNRSAKAVVKHVRISPRKVRLVINAIRYKPVTLAFPILASLNKKAAKLTEKALKSAVANAKVLGMDETRLYVSEVRADGGPVLKRFMSRSMGRADRILKRTTHLSLAVKEGKKSFGVASVLAAQEKKQKKQKQQA